MKNTKKKNRSPGKAQLCWTCKKACNSGCTWSKSFKPVEGWTAKAIQYMDCGTMVYTYEIIKCPEYVEDKRK